MCNNCEKIFQERLRELRIEQSLSQRELAKLTGLDQSTITRYELGERTPNMFGLIALAEIFKVSIDYLVGLED